MDQVQQKEKKRRRFVSIKNKKPRDIKVIPFTKEKNEIVHQTTADHLEELLGSVPKRRPFLRVLPRWGTKLSRIVTPSNTRECVQFQ